MAQPDPSESGLYAYFINVSGSSFSGATLITSNVTVTAANTDPELFTGSVVVGSGTYGGVSYPHESTTYIGAATDSSGNSIGFIVHDTANNLDFLITTSAFTGGAGTLHVSTGAGDPAFDNWNLQTGMAVCFMAGTCIATPAGGAPIETLQIGDLVTLSGGGMVPVSWIGRQTVAALFADPIRVMPVRIRAGALGEDLPMRDLLVSPDHALLVDGVLAQAGALVNDISIVREQRTAPFFVYYHIEVANHALILAENIPAETFVDNVDRRAFDNWAEHEALYGADIPVAEMPYPRAKSSRQLPAGLRSRLLAQAAALYAQPKAA